MSQESFVVAAGKGFALWLLLIGAVVNALVMAVRSKV